jgi:hypothetical protein
VVAAQALGDQGGGRTAEDGGIAQRAVHGEAAQKAGAERVAAAGGVDDVNGERRHLFDAVS